MNVVNRMIPFRRPYAGNHDDVIKGKHFPRYWPLVRGTHRSPVNSLRKGQWRGALLFPLIRAWTNSWVNNGDAGNLRRHRAHCGLGVMVSKTFHHYLHYNPGFVRSVQVVEINHKVLCELPHVFPLIWQGCMCIIHNEHEPCCPCVSWWIVTPWHLMKNILSIQLCQNNMLYQYFDDWQI